MRALQILQELLGMRQQAGVDLEAFLRVTSVLIIRVCACFVLLSSLLCCCVHAYVCEFM